MVGRLLNVAAAASALLMVFSLALLWFSGFQFVEFSTPVASAFVDDSELGLAIEPGQWSLHSWLLFEHIDQVPVFV